MCAVSTLVSLPVRIDVYGQHALFPVIFVVCAIVQARRLLGSVEPSILLFFTLKSVNESLLIMCLGNVFT